MDQSAPCKDNLIILSVILRVSCGSPVHARSLICRGLLHSCAPLQPGTSDWGRIPESYVQVIKVDDAPKDKKNKKSAPLLVSSGSQIIVEALYPYASTDDPRQLAFDKGDRIVVDVRIRTQSISFRFQVCPARAFVQST